MSEDEEETRVMKNNKLLIEEVTAQVMAQFSKKMDLKLDSFCQEYKRAQQRKERDLKPKPPDERLRSTRSSSHKLSHTPKSKSVIYPDYQPTNELYKFSGKRDYIEWEKNMEKWFHCNHILREERLAYAVSQLTGEAYNWWVREVDDRWYYKEPSITSWRELKKLLRNKYAQQRRNCAPLLSQLSTQIDYEEVHKHVLEAFKAVEKNQKKNPSTTKSVDSEAAKEKPSCLEKERIIQNSESDQSLSICKELIVLEENSENNTKEKEETQLDNVVQNQQQLSSKEEQTENKSLKHLTSLQAKCTFSCIQSDFVLDKLTHSEPVQPSSIVSFSQILEEKSSEEAQRSFPLISELEQPINLVTKLELMPFPCDYPSKHCKEIDLVRTEPNLFVMVSALDEKRFGLENVKEFCVSKSEFDKMIPTFETLTLEKLFKPKGFLLDQFREFNSSLRVSLCSNAFELFRTKTECAFAKSFSELKNMLCESNLLNVNCNHTLKDHVFELSTSSIMHLICPMSDQKGTGAMEKHKYLGEELRCSNQIKENHFGMWNWKYLRKTTTVTQGCFILKSYFDNDYKSICLIFVFVPELFPFDVGDRVFLKFKSTNQELGKVAKDSSMFKEKPPDLLKPQSNFMITEKKQKGSAFQKPKQLCVYKETLMSLTNPEQDIPSKIKCLLQEFEDNNPGGLPPFFGLEHQLFDKSGAPSKTFLYIIHNKQGKTYVVSNATTQRYEFLAIPDVRLLDFEHTKESYDSIDGYKVVLQFCDRFTYEKFVRTKGFVLDKIKLFELNCFLNDSVFVFDNISKTACCVSYVKTKKAFSVSNSITESFDILVYNQIFDEHGKFLKSYLDDLSKNLFVQLKRYTFCIYDSVFRVFVVKAQVMQTEGMKAHAPETWLFNLWLMRFTVQVEFDPLKHLRDEHNEWQGNKRQCKMIFNPGGCFWNQIKCSPIDKKIQLMRRSDFPFRLFQPIKEKAYKKSLQGKCSLSLSFNFSNLTPFVADDSDLRSNPFQEGGNDAISDSTKEMEHEPELEPDGAKLVAEEELVAEDVLVAPTGPMTRSRAKMFNQAIGGLLNNIQKQPDHYEEFGRRANQITMIMIKAEFNNG